MKKILYALCLLTSVGCSSYQRVPITGNNEKTAFQTGKSWSPEIDVRSDVAILYGAGDRKNMTFNQRVQSWKDKGYQTHFMTGIAWGDYDDYFSGNWDGKTHWDAGQVEANGDTIWHNKGTVPYIVPTDSYIEYFKEQIIKKVIDAGISSIYLEEPEFWARAGYSKAFKQAWKDYYGFPWRPQHESPENAYLSNKLKYHLYYNAIDKVSSFAKEYGKNKGMDIKVYIPTHSLVNYSSWEIVSPEASLASLPGVDGYIAQVWTGTSREPVFFNGIQKERVFENAYLEYNSMVSMTEPTNRKLFLLTDPIEDWPRDWADYKKNYQATFTAQLLFPNIANYEVMPWPGRIYTGKYKLANDKGEATIPRFYSTQMQVMVNSLNNMPISSSKVKGTQGIGVLMSNTLMFQRFPFFEGNNDPQFSDFYGLTLPFVKRGIPVQTIHMENLSYAKTLEDIKVLIMSYSNMKPTSPEQHQYLADWVKKGGVLIYCAKDDDPYQSVMEWWNTNGLDYSSPSLHLFEQLGIKIVTGRQRYAVEKGVVYIVRENPRSFIEQPAGDKTFMALVKEAFEKDAGAGKVEFKNYFYLERGNYTIVSVLDENDDRSPYTLSGMFVDLFDPEIPVLTEKQIQPGEQSFLYNIDKIENKRNPQVLASASRIYDEKNLKGNFSFACKSPSNTTNVMRIFLPESPENITVSNSDNIKENNVETVWDERSHTLFLKFENSPQGKIVDIVW